MEHCHGENIHTIQKDSPNMIKGLTPYQSKKERKKDMKFAGKKDQRRQVSSKKPMFIRAPQGHPGKNLDFSTFFLTERIIIVDPQETTIQ